MLEKHLVKVKHRDRIFTPELTLFGFLSQAIGADQSCQACVSQVVTYLISKGAKLISPNTAAYCKARARLPEDVISGLVRESGQQLENQAEPEWLWRGKHVKLVDGSTLSMPDTLENQSTYPQPNRGSRAKSPKWSSRLCDWLCAYVLRVLIFHISLEFDVAGLYKKGLRSAEYKGFLVF
jgi:hypothetical protein